MPVGTVQHGKCSEAARGRLDVNGEEAAVWVDVSSVSIGAALKVDEKIVEDVCW